MSVCNPTPVFSESLFASCSWRYKDNIVAKASKIGECQCDFSVSKDLATFMAFLYHSKNVTRRVYGAFSLCFITTAHFV